MRWRFADLSVVLLLFFLQGFVKWVCVVLMKGMSTDCMLYDVVVGKYKKLPHKWKYCPKTCGIRYTPFGFETTRCGCFVFSPKMAQPTLGRVRRSASGGFELVHLQRHRAHSRCAHCGAGWGGVKKLLRVEDAVDLTQKAIYYASSPALYCHMLPMFWKVLIGGFRYEAKQ